MTATTPIYGIQYIEQGEPIKATRAALEANAKTIEAALQARGVAAANAPDVLAVSGRVSVLEALHARVTAQTSTPFSVTGTATTAVSFTSASPASTPGMWASATANRLLVPVTGEYDLSTMVQWASTASPGATIVGYNVNGGGPTWIDARGTQTWFDNWQSASIRGLALTAGQYMQLVVLQNTEASRSIKFATATLSRAH